MGNRQRFNAREKALIEQTIDVEVSYGSGQWCEFRLDSRDITKDSLGHQRILGTVTGLPYAKNGTSKVIGKGNRFGATPGHIRPRGSDWKVT